MAYLPEADSGTRIAGLIKWLQEGDAEIEMGGQVIAEDALRLLETKATANAERGLPRTETPRRALGRPPRQ